MKTEREFKAECYLA